MLMLYGERARHILVCKCAVAIYMNVRGYRFVQTPISTPNLLSV